MAYKPIQTSSAIQTTGTAKCNARQIHTFFKIFTTQQCSFPRFVRFVNWTLNMKLFLFWFSRWYNTGEISGSQMGSQLLQNTEINKQTDASLWKNRRRRYGSVSCLSSCKSTGRKTGKSYLCVLVKIGHRMMMMHQNFQLKTYNSVSATYCWRAFAEIPIFFLSSMEPKPIWSCSKKRYFCGYKDGYEMGTIFANLQISYWRSISFG